MLCFNHDIHVCTYQDLKRYSGKIQTLNYGLVFQAQAGTILKLTLLSPFFYTGKIFKASIPFTV